LIDVRQPIPELLVALYDRLKNAGFAEAPDQITVNEYVPGIGIKVGAIVIGFVVF
jgi:hypothetical protein